MASTEINRYKTYYKNSPYDLLECKRIRLAYWNSWPTISLDTLDEIYNKVLTGQKYFDSSRDELVDSEGKSAPFHFDEELCSIPIEFNIVFYLSSFGTVVGYTNFGSKQSTADDNGDIVFKSLNIYLDFEYVVDSEADIIIENSLSVHIPIQWTGNLSKDSISEDYKYPTKVAILNNRDFNTYPRFTENIDIQIHDNSSYINNIRNTINGSITPRRFRLNRIRSEFPYNVLVCRYLDDLVLCEWSDRNYKMTSLVKQNSDGSPLVITPSKSGVGDFYQDMGSSSVYLNRVNPYFALGASTSSLKLENLMFRFNHDDPSLNKIVPKKSAYTYVFNPYLDRLGFFVDYTDESQKLTFKEKVKGDILYDSIKSSYKSTNLASGDLNIPDLEVVGFEGSFIKFRNTVSSDDMEYDLFRNLEGEVILDAEYKNLVVNDNCILSITPTDMRFYFTSSGSSWVDTTKYGGDITDNNPNLRVILQRYDTKNQILDGFRRNPISYSEVPNIVAAFGSILFYVDEDGYYNYL